MTCDFRLRRGTLGVHLNLSVQAKSLSNPRSLWQVVNSITGRRRPATEVDVSATTLNAYFHSLVDDKLVSHDLPGGPPVLCDLSDFTPVEAMDIEHLLSHLKLNNSPGPDGIASLMLKIAALVI